MYARLSYAKVNALAWSRKKPLHLAILDPELEKNCSTPYNMI